MKHYKTYRLQTALMDLGFATISPEGLMAMREKLGEFDPATVREFREFMWDMGQMMGPRDEPAEDRYWRKLCYVRDKMDDLIIAIADERATAHDITHIALDVKRRIGEG